MFCFQRPERDSNEEENLPDNKDETFSNVANPVNSCIITTTSDFKESETASAEPTSVNLGGPPMGKKWKAEKVAYIQKCMDVAYNFVYKMLRIINGKTESHLFHELELLYSKLNVLHHDTSKLVMHKINNLMFNLKNLKKQQSIM